MKDDSQDSRKGTTLKLLRWIISGIALALLSLAIWIAGPMLSFGDYAPLEGFSTRVLIIAVLWFVFVFVFVILWSLRRRREKKLEAALAATHEVTGDAAELSERMAEAIATLKKSSGRRTYLYSLPWYVIIGPPGAGKTTALLNSGLKFPLHEKGISSVAGAGGTRYCDWWFTEEAVLIDTAGRYTTQDSDVEADKKSWLHFLSLLKQNRPKQPINGVIIAISVTDIMTLSAEELEQHANAIRKRLLELYEELKVEFPVYAVFTKADLIAGFNEFFGGYSEEKRRQVWGTTFQVKERRENKVGQIPAEIDDLVKRLTEETADLLQAEPDALDRIAIFGFPSQVSNLREPIAQFLATIFEPTRYHANVNLRGFYLTSGTQEGTPIDQLLGAMQTSFASPTRAQMSGKGKSYFIYDMLTKVIYPEAGWVSKDMKAIRREAFLRWGLITTMLVVTLGLSALWYTAYRQNQEIVDIAAAAEQQYRLIRNNQAISADPVNSVPSLETIKPLHVMRKLNTDLAAVEEQRSWFSGFGMGQEDRIRSASEDAYRVSLERALRPRLILRLEQLLNQNIDDPNAIYETLKVYLMLGGAAPKVEDELVLTWMRRDWEDNLYPGPQYRQGRQLLEQYLKDMLALSRKHDPLVQLDANLVDKAQKSLVRLGLADRAYAMIKSAAISSNLPAWRFIDHGNANADVVFETVDNSPLEDVQIDGLYTYSGFQNFLVDQLNEMRDRLEADVWVLGKYATQNAVEAQFQNLDDLVLQHYYNDYIAAWEGMMANVRLKSLAKDKPKYVVLSTAATAATSPIIGIFQSIRDETMLTEDRDKGEKKNNDASDAANELASIAARRASDRLTGMKHVAADILLRKSQNRLGQTDDKPQQPAGAIVQAHFLAYQQLVDGQPGARPIDTLIRNLYDINVDLTNALEPTQADRASGDLQNHISNLQVNVSRLPAPLSRMMQGAISEFEGDSAGTTIAELNQKLVSQITAVCRMATTNKYPFSRKSTADVPISEFNKLFAPNGLLDRFFAENLMKYADTSGPKWVWRQDTRIGQALAPDALLQFQRAADIRDAFFYSNAPQAGQPMIVRPKSVTGNADSAILEINGQPVEIKQTPTPEMNIVWPNSMGSTASLSIFPEMPDRQSDIAANGPWAFMRLMGYGKASDNGRGVDLRFVLGGREVAASVQISTDKNPFALPALTEFKCPGSF